MHRSSFVGLTLAGKDAVLTFIIYSGLKDFGLTLAGKDAVLTFIIYSGLRDFGPSEIGLIFI